MNKSLFFTKMLLINAMAASLFFSGFAVAHPTTAQSVSVAKNDQPTAKALVRNPLKEKLARNELTLGMSVRLVRSPEIAQIAHSAGFDAFYVEMQHSAFSIHETSAICQMAQRVGITALVRIPSISPEYVSRVLDAGAMGIIAPEIKTAAEVRQLVALAKLPPQGERSAPGSLLFELGYRSYPTQEIYEALNNATMVVVMLENKEALDNIEEIAAVEGLDMIFVGASDLANSLGVTGQPNHPKLRDAYAKIINVAKKHGKHVGVGGLANHPELMKQYIDMGARYISSGQDLSFLVSEANRRAKKLKAELSK